VRPNLIVSLSLALFACDDTQFSNGHKGGGGDGGGADGGSTLPDQAWCAVQQIIQSDCLACHGAAYPSGGLDLETDPHAALVGAPSPTYAGQTLVVAGDTDSSFLLAKVSGTQAADQGGAMPPPSGLSADRVEAIATWIAEGASDECTDPDTGTTGSYHPDGFEDPAVHGLEAKLHEQTCTDCHGADLSGGAGLSCDSCHPAGWRTDCTFCHGGVDNSTGAPPESILDETTDTAFGAHTRHVEENTHAAFECSQCHTTPTDVLSAGHLFDSTPGQAELTFGAGLSPVASWTSAALSCSNLYCHGNGQGNNGSVTVADAPLSCDSCHPDQTSGRDAWDRMSGAHEDHLREGLTCQECHNDTTTNGTSIATPALHVNGSPDIAFSGYGVSRTSAGLCTGTCHGEGHTNESWD